MRAFLANLLSVWWRTVITLNPLFHWQYSGVAIPLLWGTAIAMVGLGIAFDAPDEIGTFFLLAYLFFIATWIYTCGFFITSDKVQKVVREYRTTNRSVGRVLRYVGSSLVFPTVAMIICLSFTARIGRLHRLSTFSGTLTAANDPIATSCGALEGNQAELLFGGGGAIKVNFWPVTVLRVGDERLITMERNPDGNISISADVYSNDGRIIAAIVKNAFDVNKNNIFKEERPDDSTLMIIDQHGQLVLYVRYKNNHEIQFAAKLWYPDIGYFSPDYVFTDLCIDALVGQAVIFDFSHGRKRPAVFSLQDGMYGK